MKIAVIICLFIVSIGLMFGSINNACKELGYNHLDIYSITHRWIGKVVMLAMIVLLILVIVIIKTKK